MKSSIFSLILIATLASGPQAAPLVSLDPTQRAGFGIRTTQIQLGGEALSKPYPARVTVPNTQLRVISAPLEGVVESLLVAEGEPVVAGQSLARMHSQGLLDLQAAYLESRTRRQLAGESLARDRKLNAEGIVAKRRLLESRSAHREANTAEARNRQALELAGMSSEAIEQLARSGKLDTLLTVSAPITGVVLEQIATAGQRLAGSDPLYRIGDLSVLWIEVHVPLDALGATQPGDRIMLPNALQAEIITVGRMVHGADQGVLVRAALKQGVEQLRPGQFVEARLDRVQGDTQQTVRLPASALLRIDGQDQIFVERVDGFEALPVKVLAHEADQVVLQGELHPGDAVVVDGTVSLKAALAAEAE